MQPAVILWPHFRCDSRAVLCTGQAARGTKMRDLFLYIRVKMLAEFFNNIVTNAYSVMSL